VSDETITFLILGAVIAVFVWDKLSVAIVAIVAIVVALSLWATDVLTLEQSLAGFGDPSVLFIASLFVVSEALDASGVTGWMGQQLVGGAGWKPAGLTVPDRHVLELAGLARKADFNYLAEKLETAYDRETRVLALTIDEREMIIRTSMTRPSRSQSSAAFSCASTSGDHASAHWLPWTRETSLARYGGSSGPPCESLSSIPSLAGQPGVTTTPLSRLSTSSRSARAWPTPLAALHFRSRSTWGFGSLVRTKCEFSSRTSRDARGQPSGSARRGRALPSPYSNPGSSPLRHRDGRDGRERCAYTETGSSA